MKNATFTLTSVQSASLWRQIAKDRKACRIRRPPSPDAAVKSFLKTYKKHTRKQV